MSPKPYTVASRMFLPYKNGIIHYHLMNFTRDIPNHEQILLMKDVFAHFDHQLWPLRHRSTEEIEKSYFKIAFVDPDDVVRSQMGKELFISPFSFRRNPETLAVAYPRFGRKWDGFVLINEKYLWSTAAKEGKMNLYSVLIHELMHAFGIGHTDKEKDVMYPVYQDDPDWTIDSIRALRELYGKQRKDLAALIPEGKIFFENEKAKSKRCSLFRKRKLKI